MAVFCFGSINIDHVLSVPHLPGPGETLTATESRVNLGGKGANQSVAVARAELGVRHVGAVGQDGQVVLSRLSAFGVDTSHVAMVEAPTGRADIRVETGGENSIVILPGANAAQSREMINRAIATASPGDLWLMQNETDLQIEAALAARQAGLRVVYSAAPFDAAAVRAVLQDVSVLLMNRIEADQLIAALGCDLHALPCQAVAVTLGADGVAWYASGSADPLRIAGRPVTPVDTTGAGDTFAGYLAAGLDQKMEIGAALRRANAAAALACTRAGAAEAIPSLEDVRRFGGA